MGGKLEASPTCPLNSQYSVPLAAEDCAAALAAYASALSSPSPLNSSVVSGGSVAERCTEPSLRAAAIWMASLDDVEPCGAERERER